MKNTTINKILFGIFLFTGGASTVQAVPIDLNTWTAESYPAVSSFPSGTWTVSADGSSVTQSANGQPTFFYSDFNTFGSKFTGSITTSGGDDDYVGFALGFNPGDSSNSSADYLLIDWKKGTQGFNFGAPSNTPGSTAFSGLAVSQVTGVPTADEFWGHTDFTTDPSGGVEELQRGTNLGSTGWVAGTTYDFTFDFGPNNLQVFVDGLLELDITGSFNDGRFGFYNFSQAGVTYSGFEKEIGGFPTDPGTSKPIPEPSILALIGLGSLGLGFSRRKLKKDIVS